MILQTAKIRILKNASLSQKLTLTELSPNFSPYRYDSELNCTRTVHDRTRILPYHTRLDRPWYGLVRVRSSTVRNRNRHGSESHRYS